MKSFKLLLSISTSLALWIFVLFYFFSSSINTNTGLSMAPTFEGKYWTTVSGVRPGRYTPEYGDVIRFRHPPKHRSENITFRKRVIGIPGDTVTLDNGDIYINDNKLSHGITKKENGFVYIKEQIGNSQYNVRYLKEDSNILENNITWHVPEGKLFVLGDNRDYSYDSTYESFGYVDINSVNGVYNKVLLNVANGNRKFNCSLTMVDSYSPFHRTC
ncbi:signal peptidase I [Vibrio chagasii]|uniref:signal peptidase I n=1 Tax=Vibrio chagasii TaxID=170679 RepID=UPI001EFC51A5|nr:signal peptidase I [Vibrio chagasii]MCG9567500.1 signal peptidase I [Vibrio chagasii]